MMMTRPPHTGLCSDFYVFKWALTLFWSIVEFRPVICRKLYYLTC